MSPEREGLVTSSTTRTPFSGHSPYGLFHREPAGRCLLEARVGALSQVAEDRGVESRVRCLAAWGSPKLLFGHRFDHLSARHGFAGLF